MSTNVKVKLEQRCYKYIHSIAFVIATVKTKTNVYFSYKRARFRRCILKIAYFSIVNNVFFKQCGRL